MTEAVTMAAVIQLSTTTTTTVSAANFEPSATPACVYRGTLTLTVT